MRAFLEVPADNRAGVFYIFGMDSRSRKITAARVFLIVAAVLFVASLGMHMRVAFRPYAPPAIFPPLYLGIEQRGAGAPALSLLAPAPKEGGFIPLATYCANNPKVIPASEIF